MTVDDHSATNTVLLVCGPGTAMATYDFPDLDALMSFVEQQERRLREDGFHLHATAERRAGGDRRQPPREDGVERRRQSRD
jgi:hypothetical protein